jgi:hypothetical protein
MRLYAIGVRRVACFAFPLDGLTLRKTREHESASRDAEVQKDIQNFLEELQPTMTKLVMATFLCLYGTQTVLWIQKSQNTSGACTYLA